MRLEIGLRPCGHLGIGEIKHGTIRAGRKVIGAGVFEVEGGCLRDSRGREGGNLGNEG